jgi:hypothetical protein
MVRAPSATRRPPKDPKAPSCRARGFFYIYVDFQFVAEECAAPSTTRHRDDGRGYRVLGSEIPLRFLAASHRDPFPNTDGNPATSSDPSWMPLFATPNHPEYPSGHSTVSGAAAVVLASFFWRKEAFHYGQRSTNRRDPLFPDLFGGAGRSEECPNLCGHSLPIRVPRRSYDSGSSAWSSTQFATCTH